MYTFHKSISYRRDFDETKYMPFLIKDDELLEKYNEIWEKVKNSLKKEFYSEPVYNEKYLKININFHNNIILKEGYQCICLSVILIDFDFRTGSNCYPQVLLQECKYFAKEKKMPKYIIDNIEISSDSVKENFDKENSEEENPDEENSNEEK